MACSVVSLLRGKKFANVIAQLFSLAGATQQQVAGKAAGTSNRGDCKRPRRKKEECHAQIRLLQSRIDEIYPNLSQLNIST